MAKTIWQRINPVRNFKEIQLHQPRNNKISNGVKQNHLLLMALCCLAPIVLIIGFLAFFKGSSYWVWLIILLCPILHFVMMRRHGKKELYQCPECGFKYKEKEWAEKCQEWCKKYKGCNLEIIKHAIK